MASLPWFVTEIARRFADDHPFWSHRQSVPQRVYDARRADFDARTATRAALVKTSYPAATRPAPAAGHPPAPPLPTHPLYFPTSWDAFSRPIWTAQTYAKVLPQRLLLYARDPVAGVAADFKDLRHHNRFADLVGRALEDEVAQMPVMAAKLADYMVAQQQFPPTFGGSDPKTPPPFPRPIKFAPLAEHVMRPLLDDAALRPPTTHLERAVDGVTRAATLLGNPSEAAVEAVPRVGAYFSGLAKAAGDLRTGLRDGKSWDQAFAELTTEAKCNLVSFCLRAGHGKTGKLEEEAAWGDDVPTNNPAIEGLEQADARASNDISDPHSAPIPAAEQTEPALHPGESEHPEGSFSIVDWTTYPEGGPRPTGPVRLIYEPEYFTARLRANRANQKLGRANPAYADKHIHEIHPIKFGGDPVDPSNKIALSPKEHHQFTTWWRRLQRDIEGSQR